MIRLTSIFVIFSAWLMTVAVCNVIRRGGLGLNATFYAINKEDACWKGTYGRGVGKPIHACPAGQDQDAGLCYDKCRDNFQGVGPVCWEYCREGYTDTGAFCTKWGSIIGADNGGCPWYDKCGLTFAKGCSHCPEHDPPYHNDGCTCRVDPHTYAKDSYGRGVGKPLGCSPDEEYDAGLCYTPCRQGYDGIGPVCWQYCPGPRPSDSGAVCCTTKEVCNQFIKEVTIETITTAIKAIATAGATAPSDILKLSLGFILDICDIYV